MEAEIAKRAERYSSTDSSNEEEEEDSQGERKKNQAGQPAGRGSQQCESSNEAEVREDILNRVVKGLNRERQKEAVRLALDELNAKISTFKAKVGDRHRDRELLETVDVP